MAAGSPQPTPEGGRAAAGAPAGAEFFTAPAGTNQRRYEALRAFFVDGLTHAEAGARFGYTRWAMVNLVRQHRAGQLRLFAEPRKPGPPPGVAPGKEWVRGRVVELRREGLSTYEISARLAAEGTPLNPRQRRGDPLRGRIRSAATAPRPRRRRVWPPRGGTPACPRRRAWTGTVG